MKKLLIGGGLAVFASVLSVSFAFAAVNSVTPSTNDINRTNGWAHVDQLSQGVGTTDLKFISTRGFASCFEYRTDGDTSQRKMTTVAPIVPRANYNPLVTDGLYPFFCENNSNSTHTITANEYVEVRMVFGAETDERFDWTRFDVLQPPVALSKDDCKKGSWQNFVDTEGNKFKNQGDCVSFVAKLSAFTASESSYYNGLTESAGLYGTGTFSFTWNKKTGTVIGGYYNEIVPANTETLYENKVVGGTVDGNTVNLDFHRDADNYSFSFTGTLDGNTLTGQLDGPYLFTATGNITP